MYPDARQLDYKDKHDSFAKAFPEKLAVKYPLNPYLLHGAESFFRS